MYPQIHQDLEYIFGSIIVSPLYLIDIVTVIDFIKEVYVAMPWCFINRTLAKDQNPQIQ